MENTKNTLPKFVVCINNENYPASLELHKIYRVLPDEDAAADGDLRVIDESGSREKKSECPYRVAQTKSDDN